MIPSPPLLALWQRIVNHFNCPPSLSLSSFKCLQDLGVCKRLIKSKQQQTAAVCSTTRRSSLLLALLWYTARLAVAREKNKAGSELKMGMLLFSPAQPCIPSMSCGPQPHCGISFEMETRGATYTYWSLCCYSFIW